MKVEEFSCCAMRQRLSFLHLKSGPTPAFGTTEKRVQSDFDVAPVSARSAGRDTAQTPTALLSIKRVRGLPPAKHEGIHADLIGFLSASSVCDRRNYRHLPSGEAQDGEVNPVDCGRVVELYGTKAEVSRPYRTLG